MGTVQQQYGNPQSVYRQTAVETASPEKLLLMLYAGAVKFLRQAEMALEEKKYEEAHNCLTRVSDIIIELNVTLDLEKGGEIAVNLRRLYVFYFGEIAKANLKKDAAFLQPVILFFESFRDVWMEAARVTRMGAK